MKLLRSGLVMLVIGLSFSVLSAAEKGAKVYRFVMVGQGRVERQQVVQIMVTSVNGSEKFTFVIPSSAEKDKPYTPDESVVEIVKELKRGDVIAITTKKFEKVDAVSTISRYEAKPGEEERDGYLFLRGANEEVGGKTAYVVTLSKYGEETKAMVRPVRNKEGEMAPDEETMALVGRLQKDDPVLVKFAGRGEVPMIAGIERYFPPIEGEFVKLEYSKDEETGNESATVEVLVEGVSKTWPLETDERGGKTVVESKPLSAAKRLKEGDPVIVALREQAAEQVVTDIDRGKRKKTE